MVRIVGCRLAVRGILDVLARQYGAIGIEIASIDRGIMALHRGCEASRRLAEIPGIGPIGATALVAEIGDWKTSPPGAVLRPGSGWCFGIHNYLLHGNEMTRRAQMPTSDA